MIRLATEKDIDKSIGLIKEFQEESLYEYGFEIKPEQAKELFKKYVDTTLVIEKDNRIVGLISGTIITLPADGSKVFQEVIWYVSKKYRRYGIALLKKVEEYCLKCGISKVIMIHMANSKADKLEKFYESIGFKKLETHYIKTV